MVLILIPLLMVTGVLTVSMPLLVVVVVAVSSSTILQQALNPKP